MEGMAISSNFGYLVTPDQSFSKILRQEREDKVVIAKWELLGKGNLIEVKKHFIERLLRRKIDAC